MPETMAPTIENSNEATNNCRVLKDCIKRAETGMTIPIVSKYPVVIHCTVEDTTSNSNIKLPSAIFKAVSLNKPTKPATTKAINMGTGLISVWECVEFLAGDKALSFCSTSMLDIKKSLQ